MTSQCGIRMDVRCGFGNLAARKGAIGQSCDSIRSHIIQRGALLLEYQSGRHSLSEGSPWYLEEDVIVKGGCSCRASMLIRRIFVHLAFQKDELCDVVDGH
mmetsp:Transcript_99928/g.254183  ORF Transcript_99928/g.254183 Transcript_99928/m.254183 type:complete len:101 (+) Transcript_99928:452-754(+)